MAGLELDENLTFQERQWRWERLGRILFALVIIAALLGVFGTGPLASATATSTDGQLEVGYQRVVRHQGEAEYLVRIDPAAISNGQVELWFSVSTVEAIRVESITPEPSDMTASADRLTLTFAVDSAPGQVTIVVHVTPHAIGLRTIEVGVGAETSLRLRQLMLP